MAHKNAFQAFGRKPVEMVYDQDNIIIVSENHGDIIYTKEFEAYRREEGFRVYACRGSDPESKGKIENVIGFIKKSFAKHRVYTILDEWNEQGKLWLERRGNGKIHNTTKKKPVDVFQEEKQYLRPVKQLTTVPANGKQTISSDISISRVVRKDNTILYKANRYSVPLGTYDGFSKEVHVMIQNDHTLTIIDPETDKIIGNHEISNEKGILVQDRTHIRDRSQGIEAYKQSIAAKFEDHSLALKYLDEINRKYPRYTRDQLQLINKIWDEFPSEMINKSLVKCIEQKLYSATEFKDMINYLISQRSITPINKVNVKDIQPLHDESSYIFEIKPPIRDISPYVSIMEGVDD